MFPVFRVPHGHHVPQSSSLDPDPHGWPSQELIGYIEQAGCHVVGVGHPESSLEDKQVEWRWSFSIAERELIHNFTDDMAACMYLLKAFKNKYWNDDNEPSIFCSYFFKTACLWVFERTQQDESDAISLCRQVFDWLISCYEKGFLPHYFIPEQNLIGHILDETKRLGEITHWLENLKSNIWIIVLPSIQIDNNLKSVMDSTAEQLKLSSDCTCDDIIYAAYENKSAEDILGNTLRDVQQTFLPKLRLTFISMYNEHYPPINSFLNMSLVRMLKRIIPSLPEVDEHRLTNFQLLEFNQAIDESPLSVIAQLICPVYQPMVTKLLEVPEKLLNSLISKKNLFHAKVANSNFVKILYLLLGDVFELLSMKLPNAIPKEMRQTLADKAAYFYRKSLNLVYPDDWSDKGLTGYVLLAKLYYHIRNWDQLKDVLAKLEPLIKEAEGSPAIMESLMYISVLRESDIHTNNESNSRKVPWDHSASLHHPVHVGRYLLQQMENKARVANDIELD